KKLCSFCDEILPTALSAKLLELRDALESISAPDPTPVNPEHRQTSVKNFATYCQLHRLERTIFPEAIAKKWPFSPNFNTLFNPIMKLGRPLHALCEEIENSPFFRASHTYYTTSNQTVTQLQSARNQFLWTERFQELGTGQYVLLSSVNSPVHKLNHSYGELGYEIFAVAVRFMFPDSIDLEAFSPLSYDILLREVLIPEAAVRIVQEDLGLTAKAAKDTLKRSHSFRVAL
ncbi:hypothetical protein C8J57DRAFT_947286, partial [Mycena rebaudengoi]